MASPASDLDRHRRIRSAGTLLFVLGDQLDPQLPQLEELDRGADAILMAEVREEAEHVPSHRQRTTLFLAAMRHFALELIERGYRVRYVRLDDPANTHGLGSELERAINTLGPERIKLVQPGDHRVLKAIRTSTAKSGTPLQILEDCSFTCPLEEFEAWANDGRKSLVMEYFYRLRRRKLDILVTKDGKPKQGKWNFDAENRNFFQRAPLVPDPYRPRPDAVTKEVIDLVNANWPDAPGDLEDFSWPVTRSQARRALQDFIENRLEGFGKYEDAMWTGEPVLYHSRLSSSLNLKLIHPQECIDAALAAYEDGRAKINDVEGFIRQIIGWREFVRGVYFHEGWGYSRRNGLKQYGDLPEFYWTGETDMNCLEHCLREVIEQAWTHHIPRLMVIGNFALIAGVHPAAINDWFLAMYVDAVDWVTAPNVVGMSQHADHGVVGTKPYAGSGKYINRMSNFCQACTYDVKKQTGEEACPFNTFYWDFLIRHRERFANNHRMGLTMKNVDRLGDGKKDEIQTRARALRQVFGIGGISR